MKRLVLALLVGVSMPASAATYHMLSAIYNVRQDHVTCALGVCADYALGTRMSGSFTTAAPLGSNLAPADISGLVTAYSFTDGINTYASSDPNARNISFGVGTDALGNVSFALIAIQRWQAAGPHVAGNRIDSIIIQPGIAGGVVNRSCDTVGVAAGTGVADSCTDDSDDTNTSLSFAQFGVTWATGSPVPVPTPVPTTFTFTAANYDTITNHTTCTIGTCADFTMAMHVTATITTVDRLPPNFSDAILAGYISAFTFTDGIRAFPSSDPDVVFYAAIADTDAAGRIGASHYIVVQRWQTGSPHVVGNRIDLIFVESGRGVALANTGCTAIGMSPLSFESDVCTSFPVAGSDLSLASTETLRAWGVVGGGGSATAVPTLEACAGFALALLLGTTGGLAVRRRFLQGVRPPFS